jgi:DNA-binding NarL/FixJ family response regulator
MERDDTGRRPGSGTRRGDSSEPRARVFIVDDHPVVRHGLRQLIGAEADLEVCGEAGGEAQALRGIDETGPDLVLIDVSLAEGSGLSLLKTLSAREDGVKCVVVSMHDEQLLAERCIESGASGYVNKQEATELLVEAVRRALSGRIYLSPAITQRLLSQKAAAGRTARGPGIEALSDRELEVFEMIGQGLSTRQIALQLHLSVKTVETHRENIKRKLALDSSLALIRQAMEWSLLK